jgi:zinc transport system ATP-binding protein
MPDAPLISCENVTLGYDGKAVVSGLTFAVDSGGYFCIFGKNGSGKSTLMKALLGLLTPMSGRITCHNGFKAAEIGYLPQQTMIQKDFPATVREVVRSGLINRAGLRPFYTAAEKAIAEANMQKLGIDGMARRCYRELSGGLQQRTLLARALCAARKVLLLDEPAAGLDPQATAEMYTLIQTLNQEGITIMMISHDIDNSASYATGTLNIDAFSS